MLRRSFLKVESLSPLGAVQLHLKFILDVRRVIPNVYQGGRKACDCGSYATASAGAMSSLVSGLDEETRSRANALADPTRFGIFRYVATAGHAATVAELTEYTGLNHNAVRQHLAVLVKAGLLDEGVHSAGTRGRPRLIYRLSPAAASDSLLSYERLAKVLVRALSSSMPPREAGKEEGARYAREVDEDSGPDLSPSEVLNRVMSRWGFATRFDAGDVGADTVTLTSCPLAQAVDLDPRVVCSVHLGIVEGVLEATGGSRLVAFDMREPLMAGCEIALSN